jgi:hypothetical protein
VLDASSAAAISAWASVAQTALASLGAVFIWREYQAHQKGRRTDLALSLSAALDSDELLMFASNSLDWGGGLVVTPPSWRDLLDTPRSQFNRADVEDALDVGLSDTTQTNGVRMLFRYAFVRLFNHLEIVAQQVRKDPALLDELESMADVAHRLRRPLYVRTSLYETAVKAWYSAEVWRFVEALDRRFPELKDGDATSGRFEG